MPEVADSHCLSELNHNLSFDFQAHIYPEEYVHELLRVSSYPRGVRDNKKRIILQYAEGIIEQRYKKIGVLQDFKKRLKLMDKVGVQAEVLSVAIPGANAGTPKQSINLSRCVNDYISNAMKNYDGRFYGFASLPMVDVKASIIELHRAVNDREFSGVEIYSNVRGKPIDSHAFWKIYEKMEDLDAALYIHPTTPYLAREEVIREYQLWGPSFGYTFDTALAVLRFINSGIMEEFRKLRVMIGHLGECLPYIIDRIDWAYNRCPKKFDKLKKPPHEYLKMMYVDTAGIFSQPSLECAVKVLDKNKIVFGSDYPFENMESAVSYVKDSNLSESDKRRIFINNGKRFLKV